MFLGFRKEKNNIFYLCSLENTLNFNIMTKKLINMIALSVITLASCTSKPEQKTEVVSPNPFLSEYTTPFQVPPFDQIKNEHYMPAFEAGIKEQQTEVEEIVNNAETPTFENTILPFDKSGQTLNRVSNVFFNLNECLTNDEMIAIAEQVLPMLSKHSDAIMMNPKLFERIDYVYQHRNEMGLDDQQIRVVEKYHQDFVRNGAALPADKQAELSQINEQLSTLSLQFGNNLLKENAGYKLVIENEADLAGLPQTSIDAAAEQAKTDGMEGKWVFTLSKPSLIPFLQFADNRDLREQMYKAYYNRGDNGNEYDNKQLINEMCKLRVQKAKLFGYDNYADYVLAVNMAQDSKTVKCRPLPTRKELTSSWKAGIGGTTPKNSARPNTTSTRTTSSLILPWTMSATACSLLLTNCTASLSPKTPTYLCITLVLRPTK